MKDYSSDAPQLVKRFLNYKLTIQNRSQQTVFQYYHDLRTFFRFILKSSDSKYGDVDISDIPFSDVTEDIITGIRSDDIYEFLSFVAKECKNDASSRARKLSCLRSFYKYICYGLMVMDDNPTEEIESPKKSKKLPKFLSLEQSITLLDSIDGNNKERDYAIITLFLNCGMRVSELTGINLSDISDDMSSVFVTGKGSKERNLYLNKACRDAINSYLKVRPKDAKHKDKDALFISRNKNRLSVKTIQWLIYKRLKEAGLGSAHMSVHKLRHTAATLMYQHGKTDVRVLKDILGHEELSTTQIYTHVSNEQFKAAAESNPLSNIKRKTENQKEQSDE